MNEEIRNILAEVGTKTSKIRKLLLLGLTHREIAELVTRGNRGFVWNVYKKMRDEGLLPAARTSVVTVPDLDYSFRRKYHAGLSQYQEKYRKSYTRRGWKNNQDHVFCTGS